MENARLVARWAGFLCSKVPQIHIRDWKGGTGREGIPWDGGQRVTSRMGERGYPLGWETMSRGPEKGQRKPRKSLTERGHTQRQPEKPDTSEVSR